MMKATPMFQRNMFSGSPSSSEEERDDRIRDSDRIALFKTPFKGHGNGKITTPLTVTQMTPSPIKSPLVDTVSPHPGAAPTRAPEPESSTFVDVQSGYLGDSTVPMALFRDDTPMRYAIPPTRSRRKSRNSRRYRLSDTLLLDNYAATPTARRRSGQIERRSSASLSFLDGSSEGSPDASPRHSRSASQESFGGTKRGGGRILTLAFVGMVVVSSIGMLVLMPYTEEQSYEPLRPDIGLSAAGLRGKMVQGHWEDRIPPKPKKDSKPKKEKVSAKPKPTTTKESKASVPPAESATKTPHSNVPKFHTPPHINKPPQKFNSQDPSLYSRHSSNHRRVVAFDPSFQSSLPNHRKIKAYPADFTDNTQLYPVLDSSDERLSRMEIREPYSDGECVPMQDWQTTFHPECNGMHELGLQSLGEDNGDDANLFGTKGFWRNAWKVDVHNAHDSDTVVLKTLKFEHNFEDAHFEHDRVDAVAMERLTSSPHVINIFGFCGHSVVSEYADGSRVGELADKAKKKPLERLRIASDIAHGLADVHGIDGDGNATFVHLDVNPANVVSVGGTLKLNDFNIGIIRRWNTTSNQPCGFPAQYPNPQWRSPEEARSEQDLTEKVDVFSMGHIFFRLVCGHEPWNKLEPGGRPSKDEVNEKVQKGVTPFIPDHVRNSENPEVIAIRDAMMDCYTFEPTKRPSARDIATRLDAALAALSNSDSK
eukprot:CAMPEP_0117073754 /NCGR_PEP_ID=MMETSP0472-20121206/51930_1 /TAXON_ID=693140 ORGANISM="Tiarina fusus, Strain LIS" /NCGR_SAMPLE_ID=MMETSP0472 /ASSEMBLY_ACC=CAM_ASM_000603 /LENGTH=707 /DNA_ID=CAMNT_0004798431 /DNA_START=235 /DNA_END=2358 /DNA_ORIENTATION=-